MIDGWWFLRQPGGQHNESRWYLRKAELESFSLLANCRGISDDRVEVVGDQTEHHNKKVGRDHL